MTHTYKITGMTCGSCQAKVQSLLAAVPGVKKVDIDLSGGEATIQMDKHIAFSEYQAALRDHPRYGITEKVNQVNSLAPGVEEVLKKSWIVTYKPILLIFGYITGVTLLVEWVMGGFDLMRWMSHFMAGFFLVFSFFKLINLREFAESYSMYDIIAKKWKGWGYVYPFTELALGIAFLTGFNPILTNFATLIVMAISIVGVLQSVLSKRRIKCACLGSVFNLPMSTITITEDALMIGMSGVMIIAMI